VYTISAFCDNVSPGCFVPSLQECARFHQGIQAYMERMQNMPLKTYMLYLKNHMIPPSKRAPNTEPRTAAMMHPSSQVWPLGGSHIPTGPSRNTSKPPSLLQSEVFLQPFTGLKLGELKTSCKVSHFVNVCVLWSLAVCHACNVQVFPGSKFENTHWRNFLLCQLA
jgi:hypothetical protein